MRVSEFTVLPNCHGETNPLHFQARATVLPQAMGE